MRRGAGRTHRQDANHQPIVDGLRDVGASVSLIAPVDLLVGWRGRNYLLEVKTARGEISSSSQREFLDGWQGQWAIVRSLKDALAAIGADLR
jgi:hypothetical protein